MESQQVRLLEEFVKIIKDKPETIHLPQLKFFKNWLISVGADLSDPPKFPKVDTTEVDSGADETSESEIEFDDGDDDDIISEEIVTDIEVGDESIEVTDEMLEMADEKKNKSQAKLLDGNYDEALELITQAIKLNPHSALYYARRASLFIKMKKPSHAVKDCNKAISLNPDSAPSYKWRGFAYKMFGIWEDAYMDFQTSLKLDYSDDAFKALKEVEPKHKKIREHNLKHERKKGEKLQKEKQERVRIAREANEGARKKAEDTGLNANGEDMGSAFSQLFSNPELMAAMKDPEVMKAFSEVCSNPSAMDKYKDNPKIKEVIEKLSSSFGGAGGMPGGMPFGGMGSDFSMPDQSCPDLD